MCTLGNQVTPSKEQEFFIEQQAFTHAIEHLRLDHETSLQQINAVFSTNVFEVNKQQPVSPIAISEHHIRAQLTKMVSQENLLLDAASAADQRTLTIDQAQQALQWYQEEVPKALAEMSWSTKSYLVVLEKVL